jgi:glyoxylase I family protein
MEESIVETAPISGVSHFVLRVSDLDASVAWYANVLGLEETRRDPGNLVGLRSRSGQFRLALRAGGRPDNRGALDHVAFSVPDLDALTAWADHLTAIGIDHDGIKSNPAVGHTVDLFDPDGNNMELVTEA